MWSMAMCVQVMLNCRVIWEHSGSEVAFLLLSSERAILLCGKNQEKPNKVGLLWFELLSSSFLPISILAPVLGDAEYSFHTCGLPG